VHDVIVYHVSAGWRSGAPGHVSVEDLSEQ